MTQLTTERMAHTLRGTRPNTGHPADEVLLDIQCSDRGYRIERKTEDTSGNTESAANPRNRLR